MFHCQPWPPKMLCEVRAVQPRTLPNAARVAVRLGSRMAMTRSKSGRWHSARFAGSAGQ